MASKSYGWDVRIIAEISPKWPKTAFFRFSQDLSKRFERNFLWLFYTTLESYMCNGFNLVWLGCEKIANLAKKRPKNSQFSTPFGFLKNYPYDSNELFSSYSTTD